MTTITKSFGSNPSGEVSCLDSSALVEEDVPMLGGISLEETPASDLDGIVRHDQAQDASQGVSTLRRLYVSHFLSAWNSRVFEFGAVLFLARIFPGTLWPSSLYAIIRAAAAIGFSPAIGGYIDRTERLPVVQTSIIGQRAAVILSCCLFVGLAQDTSPWTDVKGLLFAIVCLGAAVEKLCSLMNLIAIERDWVVAIAEGTGRNLENLNSQMRRIDLFCKLLGPLLIALIDGTSPVIAIYVTGCMGLVSVFIEYYAITQVHEKINGLQLPRTISTMQRLSHEEQSIRSRIRHATKECCSSLLQYTQNSVALPSMALSVLYFTVLSFSGQMVTFLISVQLSSVQIGLLRTALVIVELSATWLAPIIIEMIGPVRAGLWSINWQLLCIVPTVSVFAVINPPFTAALVMVAGVIVSRIGLWGFDLSVQLLVQQSVMPETRGSFSSVEASLQNFFELCAYTSTLIFSRPEQFRYPILISTMAILVADAIYAKYVIDSRGHLIHVSKCMVKPGASTRWTLKRSTDTRVQDCS